MGCSLNHLGYQCLDLVEPKDVKPSCFSEAIKQSQWRHVMATEFSALQRCGTWSLVHVSNQMNILLNKWVFKIKKQSKRSYGSIKRYKARLVVNGFHQQE